VQGQGVQTGWSLLLQQQPTFLLAYRFHSHAGLAGANRDHAQQ
jgi:hypothetical protein